MLEGLKVIELASVLAGPSAGMFLAELGAEVIKVENPSTQGDVTRTWKLKSEDKGTDVSAYFSSANWGKRSIGLDLSSDDGRQLLYEFIKQADIVITSYKPGDDKKLKVDYDSLADIKADLIYASITGYGEHEDRIAYDAVLQAESGFMSMNGTEESGPLKMPVALIDILAAHQLKEAILLAVIKQLKTGEGSRISVSLLDSALVSLANQASNYLMQGHIPQRIGSLHPNIAPYGETFRTQDGKHVLLAIGSDRQFLSLCEILGLSELKNVERFASNVKRVEHRSELQEILQGRICNISSDELNDLALRNKVPLGLVNNVAEALVGNSDIIYSSPEAKSMKQNVFMAKGEMLPPPHFGQHTDEVLKLWLNKSNEEILLYRSKETVA